jgi:hypothetical protein
MPMFHQAPSSSALMPVALDSTRVIPANGVDRFARSQVEPGHGPWIRLRRRM